MNTFNDFNLKKQLNSAIEELGFTQPTAIQTESFPIILSGKDMVGVAQTGTGKTLAYLLPMLQELAFRKSPNPRILILVPTRELVVQVVKMTQELCKYQSVHVLGVYGGTNINTQKQAVMEGMDILVGTPGRVFDLAVSKALVLSEVKKLVIDEVDVMLDEGFRRQLEDIFDIMPEKRQNIMFSATMTEEVSDLIDDFFITPERINIAVSGTRLENIVQRCFNVPNFYTKQNLLVNLIKDRVEFNKVIIFISTKRLADLLFSNLEEDFGHEMEVIHSNKSQNYRLESVKRFEEGEVRILIATDLMARGIDLDSVSHVINFDVPSYPENYLHRIGRSGRAAKKGKTVLFFTDKEREAKEEIEALMDYKIPQVRFPKDVPVSQQLIEEERTNTNRGGNSTKTTKRLNTEEAGAAFHEKKAKNQKVNLGGPYKRNPPKYKKPQKRGDKIQNMASKRRKGK